MKNYRLLSTTVSSPWLAKRIFALLIFGVTLGLALAQIQQRWTPEEIIQNTSLRLPLEQIWRAPPAVDAKDIEWAKFGITHSDELEKLAEAAKTPEEKAKEGWIRLAILDPDAYRRQMAAAGTPVTSTAQEQAAHDLAVLGILRPIEAAQVAERLKTPAEKRHDELVKDAILNPEAFNAEVARLKTPAFLEREARVRKAILQPQEFNKELGR
ncbi:MAG: hypothetical protein HYY23_00010 [Verrucomicrobia bacterium]|nr:hypothetical protein [Verrucomicrobiota bacterium]